MRWPPRIGVPHAPDLSARAISGCSESTNHLPLLLPTRPNENALLLGETGRGLTQLYSPGLPPRWPRGTQTCSTVTVPTFKVGKLRLWGPSAGARTGEPISVWAPSCWPPNSEPQFTCSLEVRRAHPPGLLWGVLQAGVSLQAAAGPDTVASRGPWGADAWVCRLRVCLLSPQAPTPGFGRSPQVRPRVPLIL